MNNPEYVKIGDKKYKINTDFRIAIECDKISRDKDINDEERALAIIYKLFGDEGLNDENNWEKLLELGQRYLLMDKEHVENEEPDMDYIQDMNLIETSFMSDYNGLDISKIQMHWWKFNDLLNGLSNSELGNCCVLNRIRNIRRMDPSKIKDTKERENLIKAKKMFELKRNIKSPNKEQEESINNLYKQLGIE